MTGADVAALREEFDTLQAHLPEAFASASRGGSVTIVVVPSFSVDQDLVSALPELRYLEHRMLYLLALLRDPSVRIVFTTGCEISPAVLDYYLRLFLGEESGGGRARLTILTCIDASTGPLARRLLGRPELLDRIRAEVRRTDVAYLECFASTELERDLAVELQIPIYGSDPSLSPLGRKSESRRLFRELGIPVPTGVENVRGVGALVDAIAALKRDDPGLGAAVIKLDDSVGGVGNAVVRYTDSPGESVSTLRTRSELEERLELAIPILDRERFLERVDRDGCVVEHLVDAPARRSPSVQCQIFPDGTVSVEATHDQEFAGAVGQHFAGCWLPASDATYVEDAARTVGRRLSERGVRGWYGVDFLQVDHAAGAEHYGLEINLRSVGTVHHLRTLTSLVGGRYVAGRGQFQARDSEPRCYHGTDNVTIPRLAAVEVPDLVAACADAPWAYRPATGTGAVLHLLDAVPLHGRVGLTCIGRSRDEAAEIFGAAVAGLTRIAERPTTVGAARRATGP